MSDDLVERIRRCRLCSDRFAATATAHTPRPVPWFSSAATILIAGQAPGARVHKIGRPFTDPSGVRLRDWLGVSEAEFYDLKNLAVVPSAFCFPGYDARGSDLPPPKVCAETWAEEVLDTFSNVVLTVLVGGYAHRQHLGVKTSVTETVSNWQSFAPETFVLPHPSWRNNAWIKRHSWFETELLPELRSAVASALGRSVAPRS